jgi:hypothetical protein
MEDLVEAGVDEYGPEKQPHPKSRALEERAAMVSVRCTSGPGAGFTLLA